MKILNILVLTILTAVAWGNAFGAIQVFSQIDSQTDVYVGEKFNYYVIIDGENKLGQVDLTPLAKFNPQSAGNRDVSQSAISIINGKTTQSVTKRYVMAYLLSADQQGRMQIPPVTVTIDGKDYQTNPVEVNILSPGTTDLLDLEVELGEQQCYVGQPVIMTVKFYISADIGNFHFNIPAFDSNNFIIEDPDVLNQQAKVYDLGTGIRVLVSQERVTHNGKDSILLSFSKALLPRQASDIVIPAASVSADVAVGRAKSQDPFGDFFGATKQYKRFMVSAKPLSLKVLPLPEQGKPAAFYGLIGQYAIAASASPTSVNVGEPITLTIKIGGNRYLKPVRWPELENISDMAANFQIPSEKSSPALENGFKVFTQTIRATNDKVTAIPPIPLAYFDPQQGKYVVMQTEPISLKVAPTKILTPADVQGRDFTQANKEVEAVKNGLSANYEDLDALKNQSSSVLELAMTPGYMLLWAAPLLLLMASSLIKVLTHTTPQKQLLKRKRWACANAIRQLKNILTTASSQNHEKLAMIMKQYIGERFSKISGSLTAEDCRQIICDATEDTTTAEKYRDIVAACEAAYYAPIEFTTTIAQIETVIDLITAIEKKATL